MNEFQLYEHLCTLENITGQYSYGAEIRDRIRRLSDSVSTRTYRVAVIGEFKRGKSSLINALIGSKVLPTDILPMTAAVTRVRYGENKKITVHYKSGDQEEKTIEELINYATKYDSDKEAVAESIKEVEVNFPSVLCKNNIEFLDTPGMNDDEKMSDITLGVLGEVDAAIMVISANSPLSITEQNLIIRMIGKRDIRHIIFVVTHIDAVDDEPEEQDRLIVNIKKRLTTSLMQRAESEFEGDGYFLEKSVKILSDPDIFGVSSVWAMEGFTSDDRYKLRQSRLPDFKRELLTLLTAAQSMDMREKVSDAVRDVENSIEAWYSKEYKELTQHKQEYLKYQDAYKAFFEKSQSEFTGIISCFEHYLRNAGILSEDTAVIKNLSLKIRRIFITNLSQISEDNNTDENIRKALLTSISEADILVEEFNHKVSDAVRNGLNDLYEKYTMLRPCYQDDPGEQNFLPDLMHKIEIKEQETQIPQYSIYKDIPVSTELVGVNLIEHIEGRISFAALGFCRSINKYMESWEIFYLQHLNSSLKNESILKTISDRLEETDFRMDFLKVNHRGNLTRVHAANISMNGEG